MNEQDNKRLVLFIYSPSIFKRFEEIESGLIDILTNFPFVYIYFF